MANIFTMQDKYEKAWSEYDSFQKENKLKGTLFFCRLNMRKMVNKAGRLSQREESAGWLWRKCYFPLFSMSSIQFQIHSRIRTW
jgi:hypothetical protein